MNAQLKYEFDNEVYLQTRDYMIERSEVQEDIDYLEAEERRFWRQVQEKRKPDLKLPEI